MGSLLENSNQLPCCTISAGSRKVQIKFIFKNISRYNHNFIQLIIWEMQLPFRSVDQQQLSFYTIAVDISVTFTNSASISHVIIIYNVGIFAKNYNRNVMQQPSKSVANNTTPTTKICIKTFKQAHKKAQKLTA